MKLSKLFHTLYAAVMGIPLLIIPIFAININQKSVEPISIEVQEKYSVDFNQLYRSDTTTEINNGVTYYANNTQISLQGVATNSYNFISTRTQVYENHLYLLTNFPQTMPISNGPQSSFQLYGEDVILLTLPENSTQNYVYGYASHSGIAYFRCRIQSGINYNLNFYGQLYDLTKMNLTVQECLQYFPQHNYDYTESKKMLIDKTTPTTYDDTDIGSQFLYSLYKPVRDYFNFGEFFGLGGMYDWFQLNIFNGTAPLSFFIVFNVMIYWLFISLFWLLFDILIYVPMVIHKWLDKAEM